MKRLFKFLLISITILIVCATIIVYFGYKYLAPYKEIEIDDRIINSQMACGGTTLYGYKFYDRVNRKGKEYVLDNFKIESTENFLYVDLDKMPKDLINAFISIEDKRFYEHNGVDFLRTGKAGLNYILRKSSSFGGSTITQQVVKNITGDSEKSIGRKIREIFYSINLEKNYTKDEIMCMYLNVINLGNGCRGVGAAARFYYSKEVSDLSLSECATIAAITNNPTFYNPITHKENVLKRRDIILRCMLDNSYITENEYENAVNSEIELKLSSDTHRKINSWYTDMVIEDVISDLVREYDISREAASSMIYNGKLNIYVAMDEQLQGIVENYYKTLGSKNSSVKLDVGMRSSCILIDSKTGDILAVAGDVGEKTQNRPQSFATDTKRPTGSAIKPISVYAPALDKGLIKWSSIYSDEAVDTVNDRKWPQNANGAYVGDVDIEYAIANSLNTVSVRVLRDLGIKNSMSFLKEKLKITNLVDSNEKNIGDMCESSLALGQHQNGITLKELVAAYTIFDGGVYKKPRSYFKVTDAFGSVLLENEAQEERAISSETAGIMIKLLEGVVTNGTARNKISLADKVEIAGKTGTTSNNCDRYFVGLTPEIVAGCWSGYEFPQSINSSGNPSVSIWDEVMSKVYSTKSLKNFKEQFTLPEGIEKLSYDKESGETPNLYTRSENIKQGWFLK